MSSLVIAAALIIFNSSIDASFNSDRLNLVAPFVATGTTYIVAPNGNDIGPGTSDRPWATINHAADQVKAGDMVVVHGGHYILSAQVRPRHSGTANAWISFVGYPGEQAILDADSVQRSSFAQGASDEGIFQLERVSYIRVANLAIVHSQDAGFTVRDSNDIELINNSTNGTFSSGIAVWDTKHDDKATKRIRIIGNTIEHATSWEYAPSHLSRAGWPPHEALSIGGAYDFEVAFNRIFDSNKEGIDIKETSSHGLVHHNLVNNVGLQGIYVDAWFGKIGSIRVFSNVIHDCRGAGIALSVENGTSVEDVEINQNLIFNNDGSGLYFSRWGANNLRRKIQVTDNIFYHNGFGPPSNGQTYHWQTGGIYLYSANLHDITISRNIISENRGFQIGYSELFLENDRSWQAAMREQNIHIMDNLIFGSSSKTSPIESGGASFDRVKIYAVNGDRPLLTDPLFENAANMDFALKRNSPGIGVLARLNPRYSLSQNWWRRDFPPNLVQYALGR